MDDDPLLFQIDELLAILTTLRDDLRYFKNRVPAVSRRHTFVAGGEQVASSLLEHFAELKKGKTAVEKGPKLILPEGFQ